MSTLAPHSVLPPTKAVDLRSLAAAPFTTPQNPLEHIEEPAYPPDEHAVFEAARTFVQVEGFLPAPESAYAIRAAIDEALECKRKNQSEVIAFNISGHGFLDLAAYQEKLKF